MAGGGGGANNQPTEDSTPTPPTPVDGRPSLDSIGSELQLQHNGAGPTGWYANPNIDLPRHGRDGLQVERPSQGGASFPRLGFSEALRDRLEPYRHGDPVAEADIDLFALKVWTTASRAYLQWTRHLDYDPGSLTLQVGQVGDLTCHNRGYACYNSTSNAVILNDAWIKSSYDAWIYALGYDSQENRKLWERINEELFFVLSHEAGHQFGYSNPDGMGDGCSGGHGCYAAYGDGSVIGYDFNRGGRSRYYVTPEDISHVPNATWKEDDTDVYAVVKTGDLSSGIKDYGIWIQHRFSVTGETAPGSLSGGDLDVIDFIGANSWLQGTPSNTSPTGNVTYSGTDNFLGVDMGEDYLGALLRADASLRYSFTSDTMSLRLDNFEAHYAANGPATWHDHSFSDWGDFRYNLRCTSSGCSGEGVQTKWYPDTTTNDPSGWVGGVVDDRVNAYVGSFAAEKD